MLLAGSGIKLGLTEEQKDEDARGELERRRVAALNYQVNENREKAGFLREKVSTEVQDEKLKDEIDALVTGEAPMTANERIQRLAKTNSYIDRFEQILREREDEVKWEKTRHERFASMKEIMGNLKGNLIAAAYPRGGGEHLGHERVIGIPKADLPDARANDKYTTF